MTALLTRWTEKLVGGPQAGVSDSPLSRIKQLLQQTVHHIKPWQTHHTTYRETRPVSREIKRKSFMSAVTFTTDQVITGISNCSNTNAFGPDKFSIIYPDNFGPMAIEYITALFNDSVTSCRIPAIWKLSLLSLNPARTLLYELHIGQSRYSGPAAKVMEILILTTINTHLFPAID